MESVDYHDILVTIVAGALLIRSLKNSLILGTSDINSNLCIKHLSKNNCPRYVLAY